MESRDLVSQASATIVDLQNSSTVGLSEDVAKEAAAIRDLLNRTQL